ncbi:hypothetical protein KEM55_008189 [Ascosphaera atra]|nr:hypothetical protein KEM55_008189 [Ascosphaera atra]
MALTKYMSETVKARLDRTYLEGLQSAKADESNGAAKQFSTEAEMDIATLYADINDLVTMTVQQCYERPLLQALRDRQNAQQSSSARELDTASHALEQITSSLVELAFRFREELAEHYKKAAGLGDKGSAMKGRDWQAKRLSVGGLGSVSNRSETSINSKKPGSGSQALDLLLKQQGLSPTDLFNNDGGASDPMARAQMILRKRKEELIASLERPDSLAESPLLSHLQSANTASQLIADALCADTKFKPSLIDEEQDRELERLEKGVEALRKRLDSLSIDSLYKKDPLREEFLRRWGGTRNEENDVDTF